MQPVEGGTATEGKTLAQMRMGEYLHQCAADDRILLDLKILDPGCPRAPLRNVIARDHASISTSALTSSFQPASRIAPSRGTAGMSGVMSRASS